MSIWSRLRSSAGALVRRTRFERELSEELRFHLESRVDDLIARGMTRAEAERTARIELGARETVREESRRAHGLLWADELARNLRHGARLLRRSPLFSLGVVTTLAICIGANTTVFSVIDATLLRPLPYPDPEQLFLLVTEWRSAEGEATSTAQDGRTWELVRDQAETLGLAVYSGWISGVNLFVRGHAEYVQRQRVGAGYFSLLGIAPAVGREIDASEDRPGGPDVALVEHDLAVRLFGSPEAALARSITVRGAPHTVIGVMPPGFPIERDAELWTPLQPTTTGEGEGANYTILVRPGASGARARAELERLDRTARAERPPPEGVERRLALSPLQRTRTEDVRRPLVLLWGAVLLVLLIGSVNVAGLMNARAGARARELAVRSALGGGRSAIVRQLVTESVLLALLGGAGGVVLATVSRGLIGRYLAEGLGTSNDLRLDLRLVVAAAAVSLGSCLVFGLLPALVATRLDLRGALSAAGSRGVFGARGRLTKHGVVVAEVALGVVLLVGSGLLIRTLLELQRLEPGFDPRGVIAARISLDDERYADAASVERLFRRGVERLLGLPEVEGAGVGLTLPYERALNLGFVHVSGGTPEEQGHPTDVVYVTPGYLETLRVPLIRGRLIDSRDRAGAASAIAVNRAFVERYLAPDGREALGARIALSGEEREIVGVVGDVQQLPTWSGSDPLGAVPTVYLPVAQAPDALFRVVHTWFSPSWVVRLRHGADATAGGGAAVAVERVLSGLDPQLPVASVRSMAEVQSAAWSRQRIQATLLGSLAALGLLLASIGLYSLVAGSVVEREREIGLRMVMGSSAAAAVRVVATPGVVLALVGLGLGLALALGAGGLLRHLLWGVSARDPWTLALASLVLLATAIAASVVPSLRLVRTDPARALREE